MNPFQRWLVWSSSLATGITGVVYWWMEHRMVPTDPWSAVNHPLQPWVLKAHILVAPVMVFAVGLITAPHVLRYLRCGMEAGRTSGRAAMAVFAPLALSGYLIQAVTDDGWLSALAWAHLGLGVLYLAGLAMHHRVFRVGGASTGDPG